MKNLKYIFLLFLASFMACEDPLDFDVLEATDFPPGILSITPSGQTVKGDFDAKVVFVDGSVSPLADGEVTIKNAAGDVLATASKTLSGTRDSIVISGSTFNSSALLPGDIGTLEIKVTDSKGQTTQRTESFVITALPFAANHDEMYLAGAFNGWGADALTIVADHVWEIKEVDLQGDAWKIKNTTDWTDEDWGDPNCDGVMTSNQADGGNGDTDCGYSGLVNIRFNDQTLQYSVSPAVTFEQNTSSLYLLGTFNNFEGEDYKFTQTADNTWELKEMQLAPGDEFKFAEKANFMGQNWGAGSEPGKASLFGPNIMFNDTEAFYDIVFNDKTLQYSVTFVRYPTIGIIGSATPGGWDTDTNMEDNGDGTFSLLITLIDGEAKFRANGSWDTNWGGSDFPSGVATQDGPNIPVMAGTYKVTFNPGTGEYSFEPGISSIGIIGSATPGGWDTDSNMEDKGDGTWELTIELVDGEAKFRANNAWDDNWGAADFPSGIAEKNGPNIPVVAGTYKVTFNPATGEYNFGDPGYGSVGIIGSASPGGWDSDTNMKDNGDGTYSLLIGLGDGEAKFRADDDWTVNWGSGDFPSGTGTQDGANIPVTAGIYQVEFNSLTGAYSFTPVSIGIIGSATPGGWDSDTNMTADPSQIGLVTVTIDLVDGEAKFRANDDWAINWGAADFPTGTGTQNGSNIPVTAGTYTVKFNVNTGAYSFE